MSPEMQKELMARLDAVAAKMGVTASALWSVLVAQARIEGIKDSIWLLLSGVILVFVVKLYPRYCRAAKNQAYGLEKVPFIGLTIVGVIALAMWCCALDSALTEFINPQYWALRELLSLTK